MPANHSHQHYVDAATDIVIASGVFESPTPQELGLGLLYVSGLFQGAMQNRVRSEQAYHQPGWQDTLTGHVYHARSVQLDSLGYQAARALEIDIPGAREFATHLQAGDLEAARQAAARDLGGEALGVEDTVNYARYVFHPYNQGEALNYTHALEIAAQAMQPFTAQQLYAAQEWGMLTGFDTHLWPQEGGGA